VFTLAGRIPALYIAALGTLKHISVFCPLFAAWLLLDSRVVDVPRSSTAIFVSRIILSVILFHEHSNALSVADAYVSIRPWNNKSLPRMVRNKRMALR
jgi:hypothetical protein